ncbi:MAG: HAMP domain-containing sensor histidine kinase [Actinomycetota bacterium]
MPEIKKNSNDRVKSKTKTKSGSIFTRAKARLTIFYTIFISVVVILFSIGIYFSYLGYLKGDFENELNEEIHFIEIQDNGSADSDDIAQLPSTPKEISTNASKRLGSIILIVDGSIIIFSAFLGYALAGFTLKPIQNNQDVQRRFMSDASHELRTPLSIMKTGIEVELRNPAIPGECKPVLKSNLEEINRMSDIVESLLFILRADSGNEDFKFESLNLPQLISTVFKNMKPYADQKKIALIMENQNISFNKSTRETEKAKKEEDIFIKGDSNKLKQAFYNIFKNAVDYSKTDGEIILSVIKQSGSVQIIITDNGNGIPIDELPHVFERFYRSTNILGADNNGSGLGLAITKEIIEKHNGTIKIESSVGDWTVVSVSLPC